LDPYSEEFRRGIGGIMATKLERLLEQIDPKNTIDDIEKKINHSVATYHYPKNSVDSWEECEPCLTKMFQHLHKSVYKVSDEFAYDQAMQFLEKEYGHFQAVFEIMLSSAEGGINTILHNLARLIVEHYSRRHVENLVTDYWNSLSVDEKLAAPAEYLNLYSDILPQESRYNIRLKALFDQVLKEHPFMLKKIRDRKRS